MSTQPIPEGSTAELLGVLREHEEVKRDVEVASVRHLVAWAELNSVDAPEDAATISDGFRHRGADRGRGCTAGE